MHLSADCIHFDEHLVSLSVFWCFPFNSRLSNFDGLCLTFTFGEDSMLSSAEVVITFGPVRNPNLTRSAVWCFASSRNCCNNPCLTYIHFFLFCMIIFLLCNFFLISSLIAMLFICRSRVFSCRSCTSVLYCPTDLSMSSFLHVQHYALYHYVWCMCVGTNRS